MTCKCPNHHMFNKHVCPCTTETERLSALNDKYRDAINCIVKNPKHEYCICLEKAVAEGEDYDSIRV